MIKRKFKLFHVFKTLIGTYIFILLIPIFLSIVLSNKAKDIELERRIDGYTAELNQGMNIFEKKLRDYDEYGRHYMYNHELDIILKQEQIEPGNKDMYKISAFHKNLVSRLSFSSELPDFCMLFQNGISMNRWMLIDDPEFFYSNKRRYHNYSYETFIEESFGTKERNILPMAMVLNNGIEKKAVTYNYPIWRVYTDVKQKADAVLQILITENELLTYFGLILDEPESGVYIMDEDKKIIARLGKTEYDTFLELDKKGHTTVGEMETITLQSERGYYYSMVVPTKVAISDAKELHQTFIQWILFFTVLDIGLGVFFAFRYTRPIKNIIKNINQFVGKNSGEYTLENHKVYKSEYDVIEEGVEHLMSDLRNYRSFSFNNCLLSGEFLTNEEVIYEGKQIGEKYGNMQYIVVALSTSEHEANQFGLLSIVSCCVMNDKTILICGYEVGKSRELIYSEIKELKVNLEAIEEKKINIGVGLVYANETEIAFSYNQSLIALGSIESNVEKDGEIVFYADFSFDKSIIYFSNEMGQKLLNITRKGDLIALEKELDMIIYENINKRNLSIIMKKLLVSDIVSIVLVLMNEDITIENIHSVEEILSLNDFSQAMERVKDEFMRLCRHNKIQQENKKENYRYMLTEYIMEHYTDTQLTLGKMADDLSLSEGYLSGFFKEHTGEVFSKYLERVRIEKAKELIKEGGYKIEEISERVGYSNSGSFRRAFKKVTGVSPSSWKNE